MSYCSFCLNRPLGDVHLDYHNHHYGFSISSDNELFGRLVLEINQAGLSWDTILKKEPAFRIAYHDFQVHKIADYKLEDEERLMNDSGIIRNKLKIKATIYNAQKVMQIQQENGSFCQWLDLHHPKTIEEWNKLFKKTFKFVGTKIVNEFLMSTGYMRGAHDESCPVFQTIIKTEPKWLRD